MTGLSAGYQLAIGGTETRQTMAAIFWLKNRRPDRWRDVQQIDLQIGQYLLSDHPMSEEQWIAERTVIEGKRVTPALPDADGIAEKSSNINDLDSGPPSWLTHEPTRDH